MKASRTYTPNNSDIPEPSAADLAAGIVGPMSIPVHTPIPLLRLKTRQYRKDKARIAAYRNLLKREGRKPYVPMNIKHLQKMWRLRSSHGLPVTSFRDKAQRLSDSLDEEFHVMQNQSSVCLCLSCRHLRRWSSTIQPYCCTNTHCRITFASFIDLYEHQLDVHGGLDSRDYRIVSELYHQQQGMLALPPSTVYAGQQFLIPSRPPTPWKSMDELDEEARTLLERLREGSQDLFLRPFKLFKRAYELVKRNGWKEMKRQYQIAMEHYFAAMKYPASSRGFHDGCPSVERGRNWLTSTDREDARFLYPFSLGDKVDVDVEFVLIDTKRDEEMCIELSGDEEDEDASVDGDNASEQKMSKMDEDVEMKEFDGDGLAAAQERKVFKVDSGDGVDLKSSEGNDCEATEQKVFDDVDNENDEVNRVKSEDSDSNCDAQSSRDDDKFELKFYKLPDSASDSESDSENDEDETASKVESSSEDDSDSDTGVASKIIKDEATVSDSDSDSESDDDKTVSNVQLSSSQDSSDSNNDVAFNNRPKDETSSLVSSSDSDTDTDKKHKSL